MIRITAKQDGFRRCGVAHPAAPTEHADDAFTSAQLKQLEVAFGSTGNDIFFRVVGTLDDATEAADSLPFVGGSLAFTASATVRRSVVISGPYKFRVEVRKGGVTAGSYTPNVYIRKNGISA